MIERNDDEYSFGYSKEYIYTKVYGKHEIGNIIEVKIEKVDKEVIGRVIK